MILVAVTRLCIWYFGSLAIALFYPSKHVSSRSLFDIYRVMKGFSVREIFLIFFPVISLIDDGGGHHRSASFFQSFLPPTSLKMSSRSHNPLCLLAKDMKARVACQLSSLVCTFGKKRTSRVKAPAFSVERTNHSRTLRRKPTSCMPLCLYTRHAAACH